MYKIKILLPLFLVLIIAGLTLIPTKSEALENNIITSSETGNNLIQKDMKSFNIRYKSLGTMKASWYGPRFHGRLTANGEMYDQMDYTAAHKSLPFGTLLKLTNPKNKKSVVVRINDRGPYIPGRQIDLSKKVAMELGTFNKGVVKLVVEKISIDGVDNPILN